MRRFLKKLFSSKAAHAPKKAARTARKSGQAPLIISFDGRVMRLRIPDL